MSQEPSAAKRHEWDGGYPYRACKRCKTLDLGKPLPCRGWYFGKTGERIYVEAKSGAASRV